MYVNKKIKIWKNKKKKNKRATGEHLYYFFQLPLTLLYTITSSWCGRFDSPCMYLFTFYILFCYFPHPHFVTTIFVRFCSFRVVFVKCREPNLKQPSGAPQGGRRPALLIAPSRVQTSLSDGDLCRFYCKLEWAN
jgi:hypothetical protein